MYSPAEDSFFLAECSRNYLEKKNKKIKILDLGAGKGIQIETCKKLGFKNLTASDADKEAVSFLKNKGFNAIKSNLFSNIKEKYDLIIFNPPYLPESKYDKKLDTTGA